MLNEPVTAEGSVDAMEVGSESGSAAPEGGNQVQAGPGVNYIRVTADEKEAIERVSS